MIEIENQAIYSTRNNPRSNAREIKYYLVEYYEKIARNSIQITNHVFLLGTNYLLFC
jgi:hypothetical protein